MNANRAILSIYTTPPLNDIESDQGIDDPPSWSIRVTDQQTTLDGARVVTGEIAYRSRTESEETVIGEDGGINTEPVEETRFTHAEFLALYGVDTPFFALDRSEGAEKHLRNVEGTTGGQLELTELNLNRLSQHLEKQGANIETVGWSEIGEDADGSAMYYPDSNPDRELLERAGKGHKMMLGFNYKRESRYVRGIAAGSGYVAAYEPEFTDSEFAAWINDEILPFAHLSDDEPPEIEAEQATLTAGGASE